MNDMKLRKQWQQIWADMIEYTKNNWCNAIYDPSLLYYDNINYEKNTTDLVLPVAVRLNPEVYELWTRLLDAYKKTPKQGDWSLKEPYWKEMHILTKIRMSVYNVKGDRIAYAVGYFFVGGGVYANGDTDKEDYKHRCFDTKELGTSWKTCRFVADEINPETITGNLTIELEPSCKGGMVRAMQSKEMFYNAK